MDKRLERLGPPARDVSLARPRPEPPIERVVVRQIPGARSSFEAWCDRQIDLSSKLPDPRAVLREQVRALIREMSPADGDTLYATYVTADLNPGSDVENLLFTNVDPNGNIFKRLTQTGLAYEYVPEDPSRWKGAPALSHCSIYELGPAGRQPRHWSEGELIAAWTRTPVPSVPAATSCGPIWFALRADEKLTLNFVDRGAGSHRAPLSTKSTVCQPGLPPHFGIDVTLHGSGELVLNLAEKLKPITDAVVMALCAEDGRSAAEGVSKFARRCGKKEDIVRQRLLDTTHAVFGKCALVSAAGQGLPPDSGCVMARLRFVADGDPMWRMTARVMTLVPRSPAP